MAYIYPKFSRYELPGIRIGGAGLGNLLFSWARAIAAMEKHDLIMLWPTWPSIKLGPWIRREKDKRLYANLFSNQTGMKHGLEKYIRLCFSPKVHARNLNAIDWKALGKNTIVVYDDYQDGSRPFQMNFEDIMDAREAVVKTILNHLAPRWRPACEFSARDAINVHIRLGDFSKQTENLNAGKNNTRIQIGWYISTIQKIRDAAGWSIPVHVFSDGTDEELTEIMKMENVRRVTFGSSIADIVALSKAPLMIASGSSFSLWARFIGNQSSISYPNQIKDRVYTGKDGFEIELGERDAFTKSEADIIRRMYPAKRED